MNWQNGLKNMFQLYAIDRHSLKIQTIKEEKYTIMQNRKPSRL